MKHRMSSEAIPPHLRKFFKPVQQTDKSRTNRGSLKTNLLGGKVPDGLKPKDLVLIPERFVIAMQDDGWWVRSRIAWCKLAPMPESVRDRPTNAWEPIYMFTKSARYFWDADAVREDAALTGGGEHGRHSAALYGVNTNGMGATTLRSKDKAGRNMWSYWLLSPDPSPEAHFAVFPKEVPRRCIAAATSDKGECPKCGKPWVRQTETIGRRGHDWNKNNRAGGDRLVVGQSASESAPEIVTRTVGWAPQCAHDLPPIPQTVLDPFVGSGTTTMVARSMLRRSIGIDLSEEYLHDIALKKNNQMALMPSASDLEPAS